MSHFIKTEIEVKRDCEITPNSLSEKLTVTIQYVSNGDTREFETEDVLSRLEKLLGETLES